MLFSRLHVSPEVTALFEVSPRLLFNVWSYAGIENVLFQIFVERHNGDYRI